MQQRAASHAGHAIEANEPLFDAVDFAGDVRALYRAALLQLRFPARAAVLTRSLTTRSLVQEAVAIFLELRERGIQQRRLRSQLRSQHERSDDGDHEKRARHCNRREHSMRIPEYDDHDESEQ